MSGGEEKTEAPSELRLEEARKKGRVAKSADVVALSSFFLVLLLLYFYLEMICKKIASLFIGSYNHGLLSVDKNFIEAISIKAFDLWFFICLPVLGAATLGSIIGNVGQFGFLLTSHPLKPDIKKIDPIKGLKKIFSKDRGVELLKQIVKFTSVAVVILLTIKNSLRNISLLFRVELKTSIETCLEIIFDIFLSVIGCFIIIAAFDFFWQRFSFFKSLSMSKYEVKKEYKQQEGDPLLKHERKRIHKENLDALLSNNVEDASVVITNPGHIATALRYDEKIDDVPRLIGKGIGKNAQVIIKEARYKGIPILRNVPLAHDLITLKINDEIPKHLYDSVAEVIAFIYELDARQQEEVRIKEEKS